MPNTEDAVIRAAYRERRRIERRAAIWCPRLMATGYITDSAAPTPGSVPAELLAAAKAALAVGEYHEGEALRTIYRDAVIGVGAVLAALRCEVLASPRLRELADAAQAALERLGEPKFAARSYVRRPGVRYARRLVEALDLLLGVLLHHQLIGDNPLRDAAAVEMAYAASQAVMWLREPLPPAEAAARWLPQSSRLYASPHAFVWAPMYPSAFPERYEPARKRVLAIRSLAVALMLRPDEVRRYEARLRQVMPRSWELSQPRESSIRLAARVAREVGHSLLDRLSDPNADPPQIAYAICRTLDRWLAVELLDLHVKGVISVPLS